MSETTVVFLVLFAFFIGGVYLFVWFLASLNKKKSPCPKCGYKTKPHKTIIQGTQATLGETNLVYGLMSGFGLFVLGLGGMVLAGFLLTSNVRTPSGGTSCSGITVLPLAFMALYNGGRILISTFRSKGRMLTCHYKCVKCNNEWSEENIKAS